MTNISGSYIPPHILILFASFKTNVNCAIIQVEIEQDTRFIKSGHTRTQI